MHTSTVRGLRTDHVTYDDKKLLDLHEKIIESMFGLIEVPLSMVEDQQSGGNFLKDLSTLTSIHALHASLYFKHEAYSDESEYRFMTVEPSTKPLQGMKRRLRPHELVRYTELDWRHLAKNALVEVVIGPAAPTSETYVRECVHEYHHREVKVRRSSSLSNSAPMKRASSGGRGLAWADLSGPSRSIGDLAAVWIHGRLSKESNVRVGQVRRTWRKPACKRGFGSRPPRATVRSSM
jgi:hypothetical protein